MKIAVTGANGFIGQILVNKLIENNFDVKILSRMKKPLPENWFGKVKVCNLDLVSSSTEQLSDFVDNIDVLIHCAGQLTNQSIMRDLHVIGTQKLIDASKNKIKHWVQLSSVGVYGVINKGYVTESYSTNPISEYERTKLESDKLVIEAGNKNYFTYSILRPSNVYGESMTNQSLFSLIKMIDKGLFFFIGRKGASANYIHVDNVVEALIKCCSHQNAKNRIFNISDNITLEEFVSIISRNLKNEKKIFRIPEILLRLVAVIFGKLPKFPLTNDRINALTNRSKYLNDSIEKELGYKNVVNFENGLSRLVSQYKKINKI